MIKKKSTLLFIVIFRYITVHCINIYVNIYQLYNMSLLTSDIIYACTVHNFFNSIIDIIYMLFLIFNKLFYSIVNEDITLTVFLFPGRYYPFLCQLSSNKYDLLPGTALGYFFQG